MNADSYVAPSLAVGALFTASGITGFGKSGKCKAAKTQLAQRQAQARIAPLHPGAAPMVQAVIVSPSADTLTIGEQLQLVAMASTVNGEIIPDLVFTWSSLNELVLSVSPVGLVTARAKGMAVIAASAGSVTGTASILVVTGN